MALTEQQIQEIKEQQSQENSTKRVTSPELEKILYEAIPILDHGFIRVIDYMGDDSSIVQAARVSYGKGTKKVSTDEGLIRYLLRHWHSTPFEMCEIKYHVKLPIFIARQWIRHRTANVNEYSARYSILDKEFYIPTEDKLAAQSKSNRQGRGDILTGDQAQEVLNILKDDSTRTYQNYEKMLNERYDGSVIDENKNGLARELARMNLTLNSYTQWYWKTDLLNLMNFLFLRADIHAQYEIRVYAEAMIETLKKWVPITHSAFLDYRVGAAHISAKALRCNQKIN
jgi:thymidylate synthase (FAD)